MNYMCRGKGRQRYQGRISGFAQAIRWMGLPFNETGISKREIKIPAWTTTVVRRLHSIHLERLSRKFVR